jgi:hypothetical protein
MNESFKKKKKIKNPKSKKKTTSFVLNSGIKNKTEVQLESAEEVFA